MEKTYLALSAEPPEEFVRLEFWLLVGHNAWHFKDEAWFRLLVESNRVKGQHARKCGRSRRVARSHARSPHAGRVASSVTFWCLKHQRKSKHISLISASHQTKSHQQTYILPELCASVFFSIVVEKIMYILTPKRLMKKIFLQRSQNLPMY